MSKNQNNAEAVGDWTEIMLQKEANSKTPEHVTVEDQFLTAERKSESYRELQKQDCDIRLLLHLYYFEELITSV